MSLRKECRQNQLREKFIDCCEATDFVAVTRAIMVKLILPVVEERAATKD